jgi:hypothetical protein
VANVFHPRGADPAGGRTTDDRRATAGLAHVASLAFLATRVAPPLGFPLSVAGGTALARAGAGSLRSGYGVALAAVLETVAIAGPNRLGGPLTSALTAPLIGHLHSRGHRNVVQMAACAGLRFIYTAATTAVFIFVLSGGPRAYAGAYDRVVAPLPLLPMGAAASILVTAAGLVTWALLAGVVQVLTCGRALGHWREGEDRGDGRPIDPPDPSATGTKTFDPRAVVAAAVLAFAGLLATLSWSGVVVSAAWLGCAWLLSQPDREPLGVGLPLAVVLGLLAALISLLSDPGIERVLQLGLRASLLVLVATWLRAATGEVGFREVARRALWRLRFIPATAEAGSVLAQLGPKPRVATAVRRLNAIVSQSRRTPAGLLDSVLRWVAAEADRFRPPELVPQADLRVDVVDAVLVLSALIPLTVAIA